MKVEGQCVLKGEAATLVNPTIIKAAVAGVAIMIHGLTMQTTLRTNRITRVHPADEGVSHLVPNRKAVVVVGTAVNHPLEGMNHMNLIESQVPIGAEEAEEVVTEGAAGVDVVEVIDPEEDADAEATISEAAATSHPEAEVAVVATEEKAAAGEEQDEAIEIREKTRMERSRPISK